MSEKNETPEIMTKEELRRIMDEAFPPTLADRYRRFICKTFGHRRVVPIGRNTDGEPLLNCSYCGHVGPISAFPMDIYYTRKRR